MPNVPYPYEVNWQLVAGNGSLTPICSLSKHSLSPSLTVLPEKVEKKPFGTSYQTKLPKWNHFNRSLVTLFHYSFTRAAWFCKFWAGQLRGDAEMSQDHKAFIQKSLCVISKSAFNLKKFSLRFVIDKMIFNALHFC